MVQNPVKFAIIKTAASPAHNGPIVEPIGLIGDVVGNSGLKKVLFSGVLCSVNA